MQQTLSQRDTLSRAMSVPTPITDERAALDAKWKRGCQLLATTLAAGALMNLAFVIGGAA